MSKRILVLVTFIALGFSSYFSVKADDETHESSQGHSEEDEHKHEAGEEHKADEKDEHGHGAEEEHAHGEEEAGHGHDQEGGHGHEEGEEDEHGHGGSRAVGPDKGITEANEKLGFKLSEEAVKNFGITTKDVTGPGTLTLPRSSIFFGLQERNVYRVRNGYYKRIDFETISKSFSQLTISVSDLKAGDKIVLSGLGFLRIAEIAAFGGIGEGHAH